MFARIEAFLDGFWNKLSGIGRDAGRTRTNGLEIAYAREQHTVHYEILFIVNAFTQTLERDAMDTMI